MSILTPFESIANMIDLIGIFARPNPFFLTFHKKKTLAVERIYCLSYNVVIQGLTNPTARVAKGKCFQWSG